MLRLLPLLAIPLAAQSCCLWDSTDDRWFCDFTETDTPKYEEIVRCNPPTAFVYRSGGGRAVCGEKRETCSQRDGAAMGSDDVRLPSESLRKERNAKEALISELRQIAETGELPEWAPDGLIVSTEGIETSVLIQAFCRAAVKRLEQES